MCRTIFYRRDYGMLSHAGGNTPFSVSGRVHIFWGATPGFARICDQKTCVEWPIEVTAEAKDAATSFLPTDESLETPQDSSSLL